MITGFITALIAFIQAIPAITGGINTFVQSYYNNKTQITVARVGGDVAIAQALVSGVVDEKKVSISFLQTIASSPVLMFFIGLFVIPTGVWYGKCVLWDTVLGWGTTDALHGQVATIANIVVGGLFGVGGMAGLAATFNAWRK